MGIHQDVSNEDGIVMSSVALSETDLTPYLNRPTKRMLGSHAKALPRKDTELCKEHGCCAHDFVVSAIFSIFLRIIFKNYNILYSSPILKFQLSKIGYFYPSILPIKYPYFCNTPKMSDFQIDLSALGYNSIIEPTVLNVGICYNMIGKCPKTVIQNFKNQHKLKNSSFTKETAFRL